MNKLKNLLESLIYSVAVTLVFGVLAVIPFLNFLAVLWPSPYIYLTVRKGGVAGGLAFFLSVLWLTLILNPIAALLYTVLFGPIIIVVSLMMRKKSELFECVVMAAGVFLLSLGMVFGAAYLYFGQDLVTVAMTGMKRVLSDPSLNFKQMMSLYQQAGIIDKGWTLDQVISQIERIIRLILPSMVLITSIVTGFLNDVIPAAALRKKGVELPVAPPFARWALPKGTGLGFFSILTAAFIGSMMKLSNFDLVLYTIINLVSFIFMVQGLAFGEFLLKRKNIHIGLRVIILTLAFVLLQYALALAGMFEQMFRIRRAMEHWDEGLKS